MTVDVTTTIRCDEPGCRAVWPRTNGEWGYVRKLASEHGWTFDAFGAFAGDRCPDHADPRCTGTLGSRPGWMSPDQYDPCRCRLDRGHDGPQGEGS